MLRELRPDDVVLDIGANIGVHTLFAALRADTVVSVEPDGPNEASLHRNLVRNHARNVTVVPSALTDHETYLYISRGNKIIPDGSAFVNDGPTANEATTSLVHAISGDALVKSGFISHPSVVKIDVEGTEDQVIDGLAETIAGPECRIVYCEVHTDVAEDDSQPIRDRLTGLGSNVAVCDVHADGNEVLKARSISSANSES